MLNIVCMLSGMVFVTLLCFRLLRYVLTMGMCMCFMFGLNCALFMVSFMLLNVCLLCLGVSRCVVM